MNAYEELLKFLQPNEKVSYVVFGEFGWGDHYNEPTPYPIPEDKQCVLLTLEEAKPLMDGWQFDGGFGAAECYPVHIWTNERVIFVAEYDGSTCLTSVPRNPTAEEPHMK